MSLATPASVQKLQTALHAKAKESPSLRFYALYDKVHRKDVLACAYQCSKANGGAAGVDGQTFEDIEAYGVERWLDELVKSQFACKSLKALVSSASHYATASSFVWTAIAPLSC
jgi:RNA-directed DNA polymerase